MPFQTFHALVISKVQQGYTVPEGLMYPHLESLRNMEHNLITLCTSWAY